MVQSRSRVTACRISVVESTQVIAISRPHGDQAIASMVERRLVLATSESHESGIPCTTFTKGLEFRPCSFRTIDVLGANASAEWKMCVDDSAITPKNLVTKQ